MQERRKRKKLKWNEKSEKSLCSRDDSRLPPKKNTLRAERASNLLYEHVFCSMSCDFENQSYFMGFLSSSSSLSPWTLYTRSSMLLACCVIITLCGCGFAFFSSDRCSRSRAHFFPYFNFILSFKSSTVHESVIFNECHIYSRALAVDRASKLLN